MNLADQGPQPTALCARTVTDQSGISLTIKLAVSVVPDTICVKVPPPSLPLIVISYWSTGLSPGTAAFQRAMSVAAVVPTAAQRAVTPVGADGATENTGLGTKFRRRWRMTARLNSSQCRRAVKRPLLTHKAQRRRMLSWQVFF